MSSAEMAALVERALRSLPQNEKITTQSSCKFIFCGGTCGRPECEERGRILDFIWTPSAKLDKYVYDNFKLCRGFLNEDSSRSSPKVGSGFGATTGMPHLPASADPAAKSETGSEGQPDYSNSFTLKDSKPPRIIIELSSDSEESSSFRSSNAITSHDSKPPRIIEMSKESRSPHRAWKCLRINADWPSPSRGTAARQIALRSKIARGVRLIKKRDLKTF